MACALERVLTIIDHRAVEIFELGPALQPTANQLVKFASYERFPVAQRGTGSGAGFLKIEAESLNFAFHFALPKLRLNSRNISEKTSLKRASNP